MGIRQLLIFSPRSEPEANAWKPGDSVIMDLLRKGSNNAGKSLDVRKPRHERNTRICVGVADRDTSDSFAPLESRPMGKKDQQQVGADLASLHLRLSTLLMEGIAVQAVNLEQPDCGAFQTSVRLVRTELEAPNSTTDPLAAAGGVLKLLETYNRDLERIAKLRVLELSNIAALLMKSLIERTTDASQGDLRKIEKQLQKARKVEDILAAKQSLLEWQKGGCEPQIRPANLPAAPKAGESTIRILIADDDPGITTLLTTVLRNHNMLCFIAKDGKEAIEMALQMTPSLILLDVNMPAMNGFETLAALKRDPRTSSMPIVLLTACDESSNIRRGLRMGAQDYILKPFGAVDLASRLKRHLRNSILQQANLL